MNLPNRKLNEKRRNGILELPIREEMRKKINEDSITKPSKPKSNSLRCEGV